MTEEEWLACSDPHRMVEFLQGQASDRKLRLFAVACCRSFLHLHPDENRQRIIVTAELSADGLDIPSHDDRQDATPPESDEVETDSSIITAFFSLVGGSSCAAEVPVRLGLGGSVEQSRLLHEIFGNPFRLVTLDSAWLTSTVTSLAKAIYEERAFDRLPILADALEDAGCAQQDILSHLRSGGEHCRGCWVVDLLTGRE